MNNVISITTAQIRCAGCGEKIDGNPGDICSDCDMERRPDNPMTPAFFIWQGACELCYSETDETDAVLLPGMNRAVCTACAVSTLTKGRGL